MSCLHRIVMALLCATALFTGNASLAQRVEGPAGGPRYAVDPFWPKPLPNNWLMGQAAGVAVDKDDNIWVLQRPRTLSEDERGATLNPKRSDCCAPAPAVLKFDQQGNLLASWGGPGQGYDWPRNEHGMYVDPKGNVWIGGNDASDHMLLKFTGDGKFLLQIGKPGKSLGSNATDQLGRPAHMMLDAPTNELYIVSRESGERLGSFGRSGRNAGDFHWMHNIGIDSKGNVYTTEVDNAKRAQRFKPAQ